MSQMYYYLYQTTNTINGKIYIGVHQTTDLDDGYLGSGLALRRAIHKYGSQHFEKVILEFFEDSSLMYAREREIVNEEFLSRLDVYNINIGGYGGSTPEIMRSSRQTIMQRYGVEHSLQSPIIMERMKKRNIQKYGVDHIMKVPEFVDKAKRSRQQSMSMRYGVNCPLQYDEFKQKVKTTNLERYGQENPMHNQEIKDKCIAHRQSALKEKYGVDNPMKDPILRQKMIDNMPKGKDSPIYGTFYIHHKELLLVTRIHPEEFDKFNQAGWIKGRGSNWRSKIQFTTILSKDVVFD